MPLRTWRDALNLAVPRWLRRETGAKVLFAVGVQFDALTDGLVAGVKSRWPGAYGYESLTLVGRERRMRRGIAETDAGYAERLRGYLDAHRRRGGPYELLEQVHAYYAANPFAADLIYYSGRMFQMNAAGEISLYADAGALYPWNPDSDSARWCRQWLMYAWPTPISSDGTWGSGGTWGDGRVWGSDVTAAEARDIRALVREWAAAHVHTTIVLMRPGTELWGYPAGTWGDGGTWPTAKPVVMGVGA